MIAAVMELLPNARYRLELEGGRIVEGTVPASSMGLIGRIKVGDRVEVEVSAFDRSKVRILSGRVRDRRARHEGTASSSEGGPNQVGEPQAKE